jgi:hypothetical protein
VPISGLLEKKLPGELMRIHSRPWAAINVLFLLFAPAAIACSPFFGYVRPSNFELVQLADVIVVATAQDLGRSGEGVSFRVTKTLKGEAPTNFEIHHLILGNARRSDPSQIAEPNEEAYMGPCTRMTLAKGRSYIMFLERAKDGSFLQLGYPFTRVNEDYAGPKALWTQTIQTYVDLQRRFDAMEQLNQLESLMKSKAAERARDSKLLAADILDHLRSRSPYKPTQYLVNAYEALERGEQLAYPVRPPSHDQEKSLAQALTDALFGTAAPTELDREAEMQLVLNSLVEGEHSDALPLFERLISERDLPPGTLGLGLRFIAHSDLQRAFELVRTRALAALPLLPAGQAAQLLGDIGEAMNGSGGEEGEERWRSNASVRDQWPEMAFALFQFQQRLSIEGYGFSTEIDSLPLTDYRARSEVTLARAEQLDQDVEAWAIKELINEAKRANFEANQADDDDDEKDVGIDPAWVPLQALVLGYGDERNATLKRVFCQSKPRRLLLFSALAKWANEDLDDGLVRSMAASPGLDEEEHDALRKAVASIYVRDVARNGSASGIWQSSGEDWYELLKADFQSIHPGMTPVECN